MPSNGSDVLTFKLITEVFFCFLAWPTFHEPSSSGQNKYILKAQSIIFLECTLCGLRIRLRGSEDAQAWIARIDKVSITRQETTSSRSRVVGAAAEVVLGGGSSSAQK